MEEEKNETLLELKVLFEKFRKSQLEKRLEEKSQESGDQSERKTRDDFLRENFDILYDKICSYLETTEKGDDIYLKLITMKASMLYERAKINLINECLEVSRELLQQSLATIADYIDHKQITFLYLRIINHLSYLHSRTGVLDTARTMLEKVIQDDVKPDIEIFSTEELFGCSTIDSEGAVAKLNKLMVNNMQMLAWVYGKIGMHSAHTLMQHKSLQRQLDTGDGEPLHWACRCCRLATLFLTQCQWVHARYHLAAAGVILERLQFEPIKHPELTKARADLARAWIHYGLHLFSISKKNILDKIYFHEENGTVEEEPTVTEEEALPREYYFNNLVVTVAEVPAVQIITTDQARTLFLATHSWLKQARTYYTLRDFPLQYVNAVLDLSELYRFLAFYEADLDSQYNVQKRRADTLETLTSILREIRPSCYVAVSVELLRELTEVQIELMGINLKRLYIADGAPDTEENLKKRIVAVSDIHSKLESLGDMMGNSSYERDTVISSTPIGDSEEPAVECNEDDNTLLLSANQSEGVVPEI